MDIQQSTGLVVAETKDEGFRLVVAETRDEVQLTEWYAGYTANIKVSPTITLNLHR